MRSMLVQVSMQTGPAGVMRVEVSVPFVAALIGDDGKYYLEQASPSWAFGSALSVIVVLFAK